jgi:uncharacterized protein (TIGR02453 family)
MPVAPTKPGDTIPASAFRFLRELARNNDRAWFSANKERWARELRDPLCDFVRAFAPRLERISKYLVADPAPSGGSLLRIYRDTRFARDKSPYKTNAGIWFQRDEGRDSPAPGYYLHVAPGELFMSAGIWRADPESLKQVRDAIAAHPQRWQKVRGTLDDGESLARAPRGYDAEHPAIDDIRRKQFTVSQPFTEADAQRTGFCDRYAAACRRVVPLMKFLTEAVDRPW